MNWNGWITERYAYLVQVTGRYCSDPHDLVNHVYLRCYLKPFPENPEGYFLKACWIEATRGKFKKLYRIEDNPLPLHLEAEHDLTKALQRETLDLWIMRLNWFERNLMQAHLEGYTVQEIAKGTGIAEATIYKALTRAKNRIKNAIRYTTGKNPPP